MTLFCSRCFAPLAELAASDLQRAECRACETPFEVGRRRVVERLRELLFEHERLLGVFASLERLRRAVHVLEGGAAYESELAGIERTVPALQRCLAQQVELERKYQRILRTLEEGVLAERVADEVASPLEISGELKIVEARHEELRLVLAANAGVVREIQTLDPSNFDATGGDLAELFEEE